MARDITRGLVSGEGEFSDAVWADVLSAVDRTYVDLVDYQEQLEAKNAELETMRSFLGD
ncbi:PAS domain-containing sensor histidine kinase, partial [Rhodovulum sulfidophilum]|nr:PAS domain-containing sensor histidine kinase [Rhodovulum sulfidophilum]